MLVSDRGRVGGSCATGRCGAAGNLVSTVAAGGGRGGGGEGTVLSGPLYLFFLLCFFFLSLPSSLSFFSFLSFPPPLLLLSPFSLSGQVGSGHGPCRCFARDREARKTDWSPDGLGRVLLGGGGVWGENGEAAASKGGLLG